jgi:hypothetical protein
MELDLETLKQVKFTFGLQSDHSTNCNGYRLLCEMIKVEEERKAQQQASDNSSERIICAAVWYKEIPIKKAIPSQSTNPRNCPTGLVFSGHRHGQCIYTKCAVTGLRDSASGENEQGFLTSKNRFVSREEALIIALRENQVMDIKEVRGNELFSEDLY